MADRANSTSADAREFTARLPSGQDNGNIGPVPLVDGPDDTPIAAAPTSGRVSTRRSFMQSLSLVPIAIALPVSAIASETTSTNLQDLIEQHRLALDDYMHWSDLAEEIEFDREPQIPIARVSIGQFTGADGSKRPLYVTSESELRKRAEQHFDIWSVMSPTRKLEARQRAEEWFATHVAELRRSQELRDQARHQSGLVRIEHEVERATKAEIEAGVELLVYRTINSSEAEMKRQYLTGSNGLSSADLNGWGALLERLVERLCEL